MCACVQLADTQEKRMRRTGPYNAKVLISVPCGFDCQRCWSSRCSGWSLTWKKGNGDECIFFPEEIIAPIGTYLNPGEFKFEMAFGFR